MPHPAGRSTQSTPREGQGLVSSQAPARSHSPHRQGSTAGRPTPGVGLASSQASGDVVPTWAADLLAATASRRAALGVQTRPLTVHTAFSGMGTHSRAMRDTHLAFDDVAAAEPKAHAKAFQRNNALMARHHYDDIRTLISGCPAYCSVCQETCQPPAERADLFVAGFSCQAFSTMRARDMAKTPPHAHRKFEALQLVVDYLLERQPLMAVLENTPGFGRKMDIDGELASGCAWLQQRVNGHYATSWAKLDLKTWVNVRRPRLWLFLVHRSVGGQETADSASRLAAEIEEHRRRLPPHSLQDDFMLQPSDPEWISDVLGGLAGKARQRPKTPTQDAEEAKWQIQAQTVRARLRAQGIQWADAHPLASASLRGLTGTPREREVLQVFLLLACASHGIAPTDTVELESLKHDLFCDISQNLTWLRPASGNVASVFCTESRLVSYGHDRLVLPEEQLAAMGWQLPRQPQSRPVTAGLRSSDVQDLVGESQALPCLAAAIWGMLLATGARVPNLWGGGPNKPL